MPHVSRPLLGVLVATVIGAALWMVMLKKSVTGTGSNGGATSTNTLQSAVDKAHQAVTASQGNTGTVTSATIGSGTQTVTTATATTPATAAHSTKSATPTQSTLTARTRSTPAQSEAVVERAMSTGKVVAILFYNPPATDDKAVKTELATVPTHKGLVVKLAVPLTELMQYPVITKQVPVTGSPTLVLIDGTRHATTIVGFTDRFEISRRVAAVLKVK